MPLSLPRPSPETGKGPPGSAGPPGPPGGTGPQGPPGPVAYAPYTLAPVRATDQFTNLVLSGLATPVDGVTLVAGDRVLAKHQTVAAENGIWIAAAGAWTRAADASPHAPRATEARTVEGLQNRYKTFTQSEPNPTTNGETWRVVTSTDYGSNTEWPAPQGEAHMFYDWTRRALSVWAGTNWRQVGAVWTCTSSTRPTVVYDGLVIYETDTAAAFVNVGGVWYPFGGGSGASDSGWQNCSLVPPYVNYGGFRPAQFRKVGGRVDMRGLVSISSATVANQVIFNLPVGFRPTANELLAAVMYGPGGYSDVGLRLNVFINGAVSSEKTFPGTGGYVSLSSCFFYAD